LIQENLNNKQALQILARSLVLLIDIFYDLNCQDLPEFFEDNMGTFMELFKKYLVFQNPLLESDDEDEKGPIEEIKSGILSIIELYSLRYAEVFAALPEFVPIVYSLLEKAGPEPKYDNVS
jgi:exportin-2 (importin alpha re-exporter)